MATKQKMVAMSPISHGYLDGQDKLVEVDYEPGDVIDMELFQPHEIDQLRKRSLIATKSEAAAAKAVSAPKE